MIQLLIQPNGKPYEKVKKGNRVEGYRFYWSLSNRPAVADATEVTEIAERIDKNPQVLKIAKDVVKGQKKPKKPKKQQTAKQQKKGTFYEFEQRDYDYDDLERRLLDMSDLDDYGVE